MFVKSFIHSLKTGIWYFVWEFTVYTCAYKLFCFNFLFLWRESGRKLATKIEYRMLSDVFGLGCSIVREIVFKTCKAIPFHLLFEYAHIPSGEKLREIADGSEFNWSFLVPLVLSMDLMCLLYDLMSAFLITIIARGITP